MAGPRSKPKHGRAAGTLVLLCLLLGCGPTVPPPTSARAENPVAKDSDMATPDPWKNVPINQNMPCACSPTSPGVHWRGMVMNAPKQVTFKATDVIDEYGAFAAVPLCVYYMFDVPAVPVHENYKITAVNTKSGERYVGEIIDLDPGTSIPPPAALASPTPRADVSNLAAGGYMNPNMINFVALPRESATYEVTLSFRGFKSNSVTIQLIKQ